MTTWLIVGLVTVPPMLIGYGVLFMFAKDAIRTRRRRKEVKYPNLKLG